MKILINSIGSLGDLNPFLSLGMALQARGHEVKILTTGAFESHVKNSGLTFVEVVTAAQYDKWRTLPTDTNKGEEDMKSFGHLALPGALPSAQAILENCDNGCLAIGMPLQTLGIQFAKLKAPKKIRTLDAVLAHRERNLDAQSNTTFDQYFAPYFAGICRQLGVLSNVSNWYEWFQLFDYKLNFYPNWFTHQPQSILATPSSSHFVFYDKDDEQALPEELTHFINAGSAPIAFTFGSYVSTRNDLFSLASQVTEKLGLRAIFLSKYAEQMPNPLPAHVFHAGYVSLKHLLPHTKAFVHHGGIGTLAQALRAGIPHLTCPMAYDQFDNAKTLEYLNVGQTINMDEITEANLTCALQSLASEPRYQQNAQTLATHRFNANGAELLCEQIERMCF